jgi:hypothetical protein
MEDRFVRRAEIFQEKRRNFHAEEGRKAPEGRRAQTLMASQTTRVHGRESVAQVGEHLRLERQQNASVYPALPSPMRRISA